MKFKTMIAAAAILGLASNATYGQDFNVSNLTSGANGIYVLFNQGAGSFPSGCTPVTDTCCKFSSNTQNFSISGGSFNIAVNQCGSSGHAQAEFTLGATGVCGSQQSCDIVNISTVQGSSPAITIAASNGQTINSKQFTCGVYGPGNPDCAKQQKGQGAKQCPANNYCTLNYYGNQTYTVTFQ